jgi:hypothetical protein
MTRKFSLAAVFLLLVGVASAADATPSPDPKTLVVPAEELSKARDLVHKLGSEEFHERELAERALEKMGRTARAALLEGVNGDPSAEVRSRCHSLLPRATALEMKARLDTFLADSEGKYDHDLPGWHEFRALARNEWSLFGYPLWADRSLEKPARKVFAELLSTSINRQLVIAVGTSPGAELANIAAARRQELYNQKYGRVVIGGAIVSRPGVRRDPTVEDIATLLFAESQAPARVMQRNVSVSILLTSSGFTAALKAGDEKGKVYQVIAAAWLESREDPVEMYTSLNLANTTLGMPEQACRLAVRLLNAKGAQPVYRGNAAATLARLGNKEHIPLLEKSLEDNSVLVTLPRAVVKDGRVESQNVEIQMRDVALTVSIILAGQKPEDFGFADQYKGVNNPSISYSYTRYFIEDSQRKGALEKWKAWREKNP